MNRRTFALLPFLGIAPLGAAALPSRLVIAVECRLSGRSAEWVTAEVTAPFERSFGNLRGLASMRSVSSATGCLIELGYLGSPARGALLEAQSVTHATWQALKFPIAPPQVDVRQTRLA